MIADRKSRHKNSNSKFILMGIVIAVILGVLAGVFYGGRLLASSSDNGGYAVEQIADNGEISIDEKVDKIMASMSKTEKLGQMVMIGIKGTDVSEDSLYMLHQYHVGGIVLFDRNMESKEQVAKLNKSLQSQCEEKVPLFIAVDEEGGRVSRMKEKLTPPDSEQKIRATGNPENARQSAMDISKELKNMGFNVNFAPVADVSDESERDFSGNPEVVAKFVGAAMDGYDESNMICTLKHFPGLGRGKTDSHLDTVVVDASQSTIENNDMVPFTEMIKSKNDDNFMVMVTHITYQQFAGDKPATLSSVIMKDLLRDKLGYQGIIITDDLEMGAVSKHYGFDRVGVESVKAGADIVLVCHEYENQTAVYLGLLDALDKGEISQERVDASVRRIIKAKLLHILPIK